jgi:cytochrome c biogenesis protein CcmG/thiol:disulfide interchange protein DsbE
VTRWIALAGFALLVGVAGCTASAGSDRPIALPKNPDHAKLVATAKLERCPAASGAAVQGGLPDVTLPCLGEGPSVHLAALRGTPTLVNIWGSWCGPCQKETPFLQRAHARLGAAVRFLGVDTDDSADSALDFAAHVSPPMRYPSVVDDNKAVLLGLHGPSAVPMTLFVDANGRVVHVSIASYDSVAAVLADVARYLGVRA